MPSTDTKLYDTLVRRQSDERLLENLLAYSYYQDTKITAVITYYETHGRMPSDETIHDILSADERMNEYRQKAQENIAAQFAIEVNSSKSKASWLSRVIDEALLSSAANTIVAIVIFILSSIIVQILIAFGLIRYVPYFSHLFPSLKDFFCK